MSEHTPGPWTYKATDYELGEYEIFGSKGETVAFTSSAPSDEKEPNARLIAAVPDLLAALQGLAHECNGKLGRNPYGVDEYKAALVAIGKALGYDTSKDRWMDVPTKARPEGGEKCREYAPNGHHIGCMSGAHPDAPCTCEMRCD